MQRAVPTHSPLHFYLRFGLFPMNGRYFARISCILRRTFPKDIDTLRYFVISYLGTRFQICTVASRRVISPAAKIPSSCVWQASLPTFGRGMRSGFDEQRLAEPLLFRLRKYDALCASYLRRVIEAVITRRSWKPFGVSPRGFESHTLRQKAAKNRV